MKNKRFLGLWLSMTFISTAALAEDIYQYRNDPGCILHKHSGTAWGIVDGKEAEGKTFPVKPFGKFGTQWSAKIDGLWHYADKACFKLVSSDPSATPTPSPSLISPAASATPFPTSAAPVAKTTNRAAAKPKLRFAVDLEGSYWMVMSKDVAAKSEEVVSGITATTGKLSSMIGAKARFSYLLTAAHELAVQLGYTSGSQSGTLSGTAVTGTDATLSNSFTDLNFGLGYRYRFGRSSIVPFVGADLGYSMLNVKQTYRLSTTNGAAISGSGSGISISLGGGAYYYFSEKWRVVGDLYYTIQSAKVKVAETTDAATFPKDTDLGSLSLTHLGINLGVGFCF